MQALGGPSTASVSLPAGIAAKLAAAAGGGMFGATGLLGQDAEGPPHAGQLVTQGSSGAEDGQAAGKGKGGRKFNPRNPGRTGASCKAGSCSSIARPDWRSPSYRADDLINLRTQILCISHAVGCGSAHAESARITDILAPELTISLMSRVEVGLWMPSQGSGTISSMRQLAIGARGRRAAGGT